MKLIRNFIFFNQVQSKINKQNQMQRSHPQLYVEVVDKNFQANFDQQSGQEKQKGQDKMINSQNQFLSNSDSEDQNQKNKIQKENNKNINQIDQEEDSEQQPNYKLEMKIPKQNQKERLIEQNIKLKTQIFQLAKQLDQILDKDKNKKKKFGLNIIDQEDQLVRDKKLQLKKQQLQIMEVKNKIFVTKRQLESVYNNLVVTEKQNNIKNLQVKLKILQSERNGLLKMNDQQLKALQIAQNQKQYGQKVEWTKNQYKKVKMETRKTIQKISIIQKRLAKTHEVYIGKLQKLKEIQSKLVLNKQKSKIRKGQELITEEMINGLQRQVKDLQIERKQGQKNWQQKIKNIDIQLLKKRMDEQKKMLILREKEKELKLNQLKIKQLRKIVRQNEAAQKQSLNKDVDMSQYRHKRNIRYLQK